MQAIETAGRSQAVHTVIHSLVPNSGDVAVTMSEAYGARQQQAGAAGRVAGVGQGASNPANIHRSRGEFRPALAVCSAGISVASVKEAQMRLPLTLMVLLPFVLAACTFSSNDPPPPASSTVVVPSGSAVTH